MLRRCLADEVTAFQAATLEASEAAKKRYEAAKKYELYTLSTWLFKVRSSKPAARVELMCTRCSMRMLKKLV